MALVEVVAVEQQTKQDSVRVSLWKAQATPSRELHDAPSWGFRDSLRRLWHRLKEPEKDLDRLDHGCQMLNLLKELTKLIDRDWHW